MIGSTASKSRWVAFPTTPVVVGHWPVMKAVRAATQTGEGV